MSRFLFFKKLKLIDLYQWNSTTFGIDEDYFQALKLFPVICCNGLRKDGHGLKLEIIGYSFNAMPTKITKKWLDFPDIYFRSTEAQH